MSEQSEVRAHRIQFGAWLEGMWRDFGYSARTLSNSPGFTAVAALTLALGIGAATVVFSAVYSLLFHPLAARDAHRLVVPVASNGTELYCALSDFKSLREQNHSFEDVVGSVGMTTLLRDRERTYQFRMVQVPAEGFEFYGVAPLLGRGILPEDGKAGAPAVFVIDYPAWQGAFGGDPRVVGKSYDVEGQLRTLIGVMPKRFRGLGPQIQWHAWQLWTPMTWSSTSSRAPVSIFGLLARLRPGVTLAQASADFDLIFKRLASEHPKDFADFPEHLQFMQRIF
jgi:putative ABC transport system permease protein